MNAIMNKLLSQTEQSRITNNNYHFNSDSLLKKVQRYIPFLKLKEAKSVVSQFMAYNGITSLLPYAYIQSIQFDEKYVPIDLNRRDGVGVYQCNFLITRSIFLFFKTNMKIYVTVYYKY